VPKISELPAGTAATGAEKFPAVQGTATAYLLLSQVNTYTAAATKTLTNTTFDTAGTGNSFSINGLAATANTGTGSVVRATSPTIATATLNSPTLVTPALGTPSALVLTNATGTPSSIGLANGTGLPIATGVSGLGTGVATLLATPSSANLAAALTDETGSGAAVFATSPTLVTPALGTPASGNLANCTGMVLSIAGNTGAFTLSNGLTNSTNALKVTAGSVIQSSLTSYATNTALTTTIPLDDTVPTNSEGAEIISTSFTPRVSTSTLRCTFRGMVSANAQTNAIVAVFQGSTNIGTNAVTIHDASYRENLVLTAEYSPGSVSAQTISVRAGPSGATSFAFNGTPTPTRLFGGSSAATLLIEEISA
jgi:hypothetical protein